MIQSCFIPGLICQFTRSFQPIPIPTYLIAIAGGNFRYREFLKPEGKEWTSGIWAEPELIDAAYWEFEEDTTRYAL